MHGDAGPGATNASAGVHVALQDSTPIILFIGQVGRDMIDREAFQEIDFRRMFGQMSKWVAQIDDAARIPEYVSRAFHIAFPAVPARSSRVARGHAARKGGRPDPQPYRRVESHPSPEMAELGVAGNGQASIRDYRRRGVGCGGGERVRRFAEGSAYRSRRRFGGRTIRQ